MKKNIFFFYLPLLLATCFQFSMEIAQDRTLLSYFIFFLVLIPRLIFIIKVNGFPLNWKTSPTIELILYTLTMIFLMSAKYKKSFPLNPSGLLITFLLEVMVLVIYALEDALYIITEREATEDD